MRGAASDGSEVPARAPGLTAATVGLLAIGAAWVGYQGWRLLLQPLPKGAIDLKLRFREVALWFQGEPVYGVRADAVYPPASYAILRPVLDHGSLPLARWLWGGLTVLALVALCRRFAAESGAQGKAARRLAMVVPLALYPVGATIGNGQVGLLIAVCLLLLLPLLRREERSLGQDGLIALLMLVALVKPSLAAFFFLVVLFAKGGLRPAALTVAGYGLLTWIASLPQRKGPFELLLKWKDRSQAGSIWGARFGEGAIIDPAVQPSHLPQVAQERIAEQMERGLVIKSINLHSLVSYFGQPRYSFHASFVLLGIFAVWLFLRRGASLLTLMGVTAVVTLFAGYHAWYDHVILLLALLALLRVAWTQDSRPAAVLGLLLVLFLLAPGGVYALPVAWSNAYVVGQTLVFLAAGVFLAQRAAAEHAQAQR